MILVQKIGYRFGGYPRPPVYGFFFGEKGVTDLGGIPPPPLRTKFAKYIVFEVVLNNTLCYSTAFNTIKRDKTDLPLCECMSKERILNGSIIPFWEVLRKTHFLRSNR